MFRKQKAQAKQIEAELTKLMNLDAALLRSTDALLARAGAR